jgi:hypothetical protein
MKGGERLKEKAFLILLLSLSVLVAFSTIVSGITWSKPSVENVNRVDAATSLKLCGDPIDGPGWPTTLFSTSQPKQ